jgi:hypothetical protein
VGIQFPEVVITVTGTERVIERHNILEPADLVLAQYSIPFCVALALHREVRNPESFDETALRDPQISALRAGADLDLVARSRVHVIPWQTPSRPLLSTGSWRVAIPRMTNSWN